ncbi:MAG: hemolysin D [Fimbriimonadales bacterium]|nr:MAG: hemolysin D [Fimbriimonadales bacterium]
MKRWFPILSSLVLLAGLTWGTWWVVQTKRPPGAMTPLEAQGMDMSVMKPPRGAFPVGVEEVQPRPFLPSVAYPATFRAYNEEIIRARITGKLVETRVYPGDRVRPGQLLAQIEPEEYQALAQSAQGSLQAAQAELQEAQSMTREAESALQAAQARLQQAQAEVREARQMLQAAEAELQTAQTELEQIETAIRSTQAEVEYWQAESDRQNALLQKGFVSKRDAQAAETRLKQARESLQSAQASRRAQLSRIEQLKANREAMRARVQRAESATRATEQEVQAAAARLQAVRARRQRAEAQIKTEQGKKRAAQLQVDYTRLVALNPGTITERLTEPGTLVQPGAPVFKLQNTSQIRVQAKVAEQDAVRIHEGYPVWIKRYAEPNRIYRARVSAVFREADLNTRTMIVEAVLPNPDGRLMVGEYAEVRIGLLPRAASAMTVPVRALQYDEFQRPYVWVLAEAPRPHHSHAVVYTCPMHPQIEQNQPGKCPICKMDLVPKEQPAQYIARKRRVQPGLSDGERVQILDGLKPGEQVIVFGFGTLAEGDPVFPTEWTVRGPATLTPPQFTPTSPSHEGGHGH